MDKNNTIKSHAVSITLSIDLYNWIKEKASEEKRTVSGFINYHMGKVMENNLRDEAEENNE